MTPEYPDLKTAIDSAIDENGDDYGCPIDPYGGGAEVWESLVVCARAAKSAEKLAKLVLENMAWDGKPLDGKPTLVVEEDTEKMISLARAVIGEKK